MQTMIRYHSNKILSLQEFTTLEIPFFLVHWLEMNQNFQGLVHFCKQVHFQGVYKLKTTCLFVPIILKF